MAILNDRILRVLRGEKVDKTPIWIMRQAGRYLPEYRAIRQQAGDFLSMCKNKELACEVTLQPLRRFDLDAVILFSDILTLVDAMGLGLSFVSNKGPIIENTIRTDSDFSKLRHVDVAELQYVFDAVFLIKKEINYSVPIIGFSGSPWTVATYVVEGSSSKSFSIIKRLIYQNPKLVHKILQVLTDLTISYLKEQVNAGADMLQIFDTWGGILSEDKYIEFSLNYMQQIIATIPRDIPVIIFTKFGGLWLEHIELAFEKVRPQSPNGIGLDWTIDIGKAKTRVSDTITLQGNIDPKILYAEPQCIKREVKRVIDTFGNCGRHIFNLGHGIEPEVNPDRLRVLIDTVNSYSKNYHK